MSDKLEAAMAYFCTHYPHKSELSKARLTKMVYLADWRMALTHARQITPLTWVFNHYGPYLDDVPALARKSEFFDVRRERNMFGAPKDVIILNRAGHDLEKKLSTDEIAALDHVIEQTKALTWEPFIKLVYSTFPIVTEPRYKDLDLVQLANKYARS
jgi:hypothetical protein